MKEFIKKISKGSKVVFSLEILLVVQVILIIALLIRNNNLNLDKYCPDHGYNNHAFPGNISDRRID